MAAYIYNRLEGTMNCFLDMLPNTVQEKIRKIDASHAKTYLQAATLSLIARYALKSSFLPEMVSYPIATVSIVLIAEPLCRKGYSILSQKTTTSYSSALFKGGLATLTLSQLSEKITSLKDPSNALCLTAVTVLLSAVILDKKRDETQEMIYGGPRNVQKDFLLIETLQEDIKALKHKLRFFDHFVMSNPQFLHFFLEHSRKHPDVLRTRNHPPLPIDLSESVALAIKKSRLEFDLESRFLHLQRFPELLAELVKAINNSKHLLKEI